MFCLYSGSRSYCIAKHVLYVRRDLLILAFDCDLRDRRSCIVEFHLHNTLQLSFVI